MAAGPYLTANRFAISGFGIDTSNLTRLQLTQTLRRATSAVNAWCNGSQVPSPFDFRGGSVTDEQHLWPKQDPLTPTPGMRRVFVYQRPLRTVTAFALDYTNNYRITLDPATNLYVNATEGWCEIIASQPTIIGYPPLGWLFGPYQPTVKISYTYGYRQDATDDVLEADSPTLYYGSVGQWDPDSVSVEIDGVVIDPANYTIRAADGAILFDSAPAPRTEVTASYTSLMPDQIAQATGLIATDMLGQARIAARGMIGLQSLKVAEVAITQMSTGGGRYSTRNGISIPDAAAQILAPFALGSTG